MLKNPQNYCGRIPTNVRFDKDVKEFLVRNAHEKNLTLADYINNFIKERSHKGE